MKDFTEMIKLGLSSIVYDWQKLDTKNVKARLFQPKNSQKLDEPFSVAFIHVIIKLKMVFNCLLI